MENRQFRKEAVIEEVDKTKFKVINEIYNFKRKSESEKQNVKNKNWTQMGEQTVYESSRDGRRLIEV